MLGDDRKCKHQSANLWIGHNLTEAMCAIVDLLPSPAFVMCCSCGRAWKQAMTQISKLLHEMVFSSVNVLKHHSYKSNFRANLLLGIGDLTWAASALTHELQPMATTSRASKEWWLPWVRWWECTARGTKILPCTDLVDLCIGTSCLQHC